MSHILFTRRLYSLHVIKRPPGLGLGQVSAFLCVKNYLTLHEHVFNTTQINENISIFNSDIHVDKPNIAIGLRAKTVFETCVTF